MKSLLALTLFLTSSIVLAKIDGGRVKHELSCGLVKDSRGGVSYNSRGFKVIIETQALAPQYSIVSASVESRLIGGRDKSVLKLSQVSQDASKAEFKSADKSASVKINKVAPMSAVLKLANGSASCK